VRLYSLNSILTDAFALALLDVPTRRQHA